MDEDVDPAVEDNALPGCLLATLLFIVSWAIIFGGAALIDLL